ncbi:hypothetical protein IWW57_000553 [Coemansia sp. S610]|nr:hypothetical protein IWW57_000553 [Coemansia sp. S610]
MTVLSPLQILPAHIVRIIVDHVSGSSRHELGGLEKGTYGYQKLQVPLLHVCRNFRAVVSSNFCSICRISLSTLPNGIRVKWNTWPPHHLLHPDTSMFHLAKKIDLSLDMWSVCTGNAAAALPRSVYKDGAFPKVRLIRFQFDPLAERLVESMGVPKAASANIRAFVQRLLQMAPGNKEVMVVVKLGRVSMPQHLQQHFCDLLIQLYQSVDSIVHQYNGPVAFSESQLASVSNLTFLNYFIRGDSKYFLALARKSASTLQLLSMKSLLDTDLTGLIRDENGNYVRYPFLKTLWQAAWGKVDASRLPVFPGAVPFPSLASLSFKGSYPFGDDTVFRGNAATLMSFDIKLDCSVVDLLRRYAVFAPGRHPKLQDVKLELAGDLVPGYFSTTADYMAYALSIAPRAPVRIIDVSDSTGIIGEPEIMRISDLSSIQILTMPSTRLKLWQVVVLVKSLPLLTDLHSGYPKLEPIPAGVSKADLPQYAISEFAPMGKRFRCWLLVEGEDSVVSKETVLCVILLALVCPSFDYAALGKIRREEFMRLLSETIAKDEYKQFAPRLQRLLFYGWKDPQASL